VTVNRFVVAALLVASLLDGTAAFAAEPTRPGVQAFRDCPTCPEMVIIPAGTFVMGTPASQLDGIEASAETQATVVRIARPFAIGRFEVTRREFAQFVADSGYEARAGCRSWDEGFKRFSDDARRTWVNPGRPEPPADAHPVNCVSWADATAYVQWLARKTRQAYRLPSEAEWEYTARAGSTTLRFWGDAPQDGCDFANTYDSSARAAYRLGWPDAGCVDGQPDVAPVGQFEPNGFGLHDMLGNVAEWTEDCATGSYVGRPRDGSPWTWLGGCQRRVQRGGAWISPPDRARSSYRGDGEEGARADFVGFRVALDLDERALRGEER
jgi:formylglycine-generating enzyme required for sulfatase activity